jgi:hypothetical protein
MHYYKAMHDEEGNYKGVNEWVLDLMPIVNEYLKETGQMLVPDPNKKVDATAGASKKDDAPAAPKPAPKPEVDATSGASEH